MLKLKTGSNQGTDTLTRDLTRFGKILLTRWPSSKSHTHIHLLTYLSSNYICLIYCGFVVQLDSMRWFSHRRSPSTPGGHAVVSSVAACCVRPTAQTVLCIVSWDDSALFRFLSLV